LAAAGVGVEDIDFVMCTHLHLDHVGWNTRLENGRWVPTFPRARYLFSKKEYDYWEAETRNGAATPMADSVIPIVEAKRAELVTSDFEVNDLIRFLPAAGHTPDHFVIELGRGRREAVMTGDLMHSPLQARYPDLGMRVDYDAAMGAQSRRTLLQQFCDTPTVLCPCHFPAPSVGRISAWGEGFRFDFGL
jgi:glyoxylase-like metal-dependent hydrolase (beta-lactamase superfamily II)